MGGLPEMRAGERREPLELEIDGAPAATSASEGLLFSVVMAVRAEESHLSEAVESLLTQTIGFEEHLQLVFVLVGDEAPAEGATLAAETCSGSDEAISPVGTAEEFCRAYAARYPKNVLVLECSGAGAGVAAARNVGAAAATGRYLTFMEPETTWSRGAFLEAERFFKHHPEVDLLAARVELCGARTGEHWLNQRFARTRVIELAQEPDCVQTGTCGLWIARGVLAPVPFDEALGTEAPFGLVGQLLLETPRYGVLSGAVCTLALGVDGEPVPELACGGARWEALLRACEGLFCRSRERWGEVLPFARFAAIYRLQWLFAAPAAPGLDAETLERCRSSCVGLLQEIDDEVVLVQRQLDRHHKLSALALKYEVSTRELRGGLCCLGKRVILHTPAGGLVRMWDLKADSAVRLEFLTERAGGLRLEGRLSALFPPDMVRVIATVDKRRIEAEVFVRPDLRASTPFERDAKQVLGFTLDLPCKSFKLRLLLAGREAAPTFTFGRFFPLGAQPWAYAMLGQVCITREGVEFSVCRPVQGWLIKRELLYERGQLRTGGAEAQSGGLSVRELPLRWQVVRQRLWMPPRHRLWLISDRPTLAGDNGEALFSYLMAHPVPGVEVRFVLAADSPDFERVTALGPVVAFGGLEHRRLLARASIVASSSADVPTLPPSPSKDPAFAGAKPPAFVFLQHGVTKDDISGWLRRWNKGIALFCTAAPRERASIVENQAYGYTSEQVRLTGFSRHDALLASRRPPENKLLIAPTWRTWVAAPAVAGSSLRPYNEGFRETEYFRFYDHLLNDPEIGRALESAGMRARFLLHPMLAENLRDFSSPYAEFATTYNYREEFLSSSVMLTDYSSVAMDFAILKKPVLYAQFDEERFFSGEHSYTRGYYDYRADGFGPVCTTYEETKAELLRLIERPVMGEEYRVRVDAFFGSLDGHASERIVEAILDVEATGR